MRNAGLKIGFNVAALAVALALAAALTLMPVKGGGIWGWASQGRVVAAQGGFPAADAQLASADAPRPFDRSGWLFGLLAYGLAQWGPGALAAFKALMLVVAFGFCVAANFRRGSRPFGAALFALWALVASRPAFVDGPALVGYACFSAALFMMEGDFWPAFFRRWIWLPALAVPWLNLHTSALLLLPVAAVWLLFDRGDPREAPAMPAFSKALFLALLAGCYLINPEGWRVFTEPARLAGREARWLYGWASPLTPGGFRDAQWALLLLAALVPLLVSNAWVSEGRDRLNRDFAMFAVMGSAALVSQAFIPFFCIWAAPVAAARADALIDALPGPLRTGRWALKVALLALGVWMLPKAFGGPDFGVGVQPAPGPRQTLAFIEEQGVAGTFFAPLSWSGSLQWRLKDRARLLVAPCGFDARAAADYLNALDARPDRWPAVFDAWGIDAALLPPGSRLAEALSYRQGWQPVAFDNDSVLFVKATPERAALIKTFAPRGLRPGDPARAVDPGRLAMAEADLEALAPRLGDCGRWHYYRALLFQAEERPDRVRQALEEGVARDPGFALNAQWLRALEAR